VHLADHIFRLNPRRFTERPALVVLAECKDIRVKHAHQTVVIGSANPEMADLLKIALGAPTAECRCVVIDENGVAIYIADITYRSDAIKLHIDLLPARALMPGPVEILRRAKKTDRGTTKTSP
jgi:GntR family transcriptional regulator